ncbi:MAG: prefoldin subunit beta [Candidatus Methanofastidiosia archaeon]
MQNIPQNVQHEIKQFQQLEQQYQMIVSQLQAVNAELKETQETLEELKTINEEEIYKSVGMVLFKADKTTVDKELKEKEETLTVRKTTLERQETRIRTKLQESQKKIQGMLGTPKQGS